MILGVAGFASERLKEARAERGMSARALAERLGVAIGSVYHWESGGSPRPDKMADLCAALDVPERYFLLPVEGAPGSAVHYRMLRSTNKEACAAAEAKLSWVYRLGKVVEEMIDLPELNLPSFAIPEDPLSLSDENIQELAVRTRKHWGLGLGPITNVVALLERNGMLLARAYLDSPKLDGLSRHHPDRAVAVLSSNKESGPRSRFDVAHELGHLILHRHVPEERLSSKEVHKLVEDQAHCFAAAFLFPPEAFEAEATTLDVGGLLDLKLRWRVSVGMMIQQATRLEYLSDHAAQRLIINLNRRAPSGTRAEPLDEMIPPEQPRLLRRAIELWVAEQGHEEVCARLPFAVRDVCALTGVPHGVLTGEVAQIVRLVVPASPETAQIAARDGEVATVTPLRTRQT